MFSCANQLTGFYMRVTLALNELSTLSVYVKANALGWVFVQTRCLIGPRHY